MQRSSRQRGDLALAWRCASRVATSGSHHGSIPCGAIFVSDNACFARTRPCRRPRSSRSASPSAHARRPFPWWMRSSCGSCRFATPKPSSTWMASGKPGSDQLSTPTLSYPLFDRVRQAVAPQMEAFSMSHQSLRQAVLPDAGGVEEKLRTQFVSGNAFDVLGVTAILGRVLAPSDDVTPGGASGCGNQSCVLEAPARWQSGGDRTVDSARAAAVPDRRGRAGRIHGRAARSAHGHLGSEHDVPARITERSPTGGGCRCGDGSRPASRARACGRSSRQS